MPRNLFANDEAPQRKPRNLFAEQPVGRTGTLTKDQFSDEFGDQPDIDGLIRDEPSQPKPERGALDRAVGLGEAALTTASGATFGSMGMIDGTLRGIAQEVRAGTFGSAEAADRIENLAAEMAGKATYSPRTEAGQEYVQNIGEAGEALAPLAGLGGEIAMIGQAAKKAAPQAASVAREGATIAKESPKSLFQYQTPAKQKIAELLEKNDPSIDTARYRISTPASTNPPESNFLRALNAGGAKISKDKNAINAISQGFDEAVIASVKGASRSDKTDMAKMVQIFQKGKSDALYAGRNRANDVVGNRFMDSINLVRKTNREAGSEVDKAAMSLKGKQVESLPIGDRFLSSLDELGIKPEGDKLNFKGSDVEDLASIERTFNTVYRRMTGTKKPDAYELHRMKRFIDEQVSYGKAGEGLTGRAERTLKTLRRDIDKTLDDSFPDYNSANEKYSDTIQALDSFQSIAGKRLDFSSENASKQVGTLMRRLLSNAQSRGSLMDAATEIQSVANKYPEKNLISGSARDKGRQSDLLQLVIFADELDSRFGPNARTSLQGQVEQVANRGRRIAQSGSATMALADEAVGLAARGVDKLKGVSDEKAFESIIRLLNEE